MTAQDIDLTWIQTQLTLVRWYLDSAAASAAGAVRHRLAQARDVHETMNSSLARLKLSKEQRASVESELSVLHSRLERAWSSI